MKFMRIRMFLVENPGAVFLLIFATLVFVCACFVILERPTGAFSVRTFETGL